MRFNPGLCGQGNGSVLFVFALQIDPATGMVINLTDLKDYMQVITLPRDWKFISQKPRCCDLRLT